MMSKNRAMRSFIIDCAANPRAIRRLIKRKFDERNVDMPYPRGQLYLHTQDSVDLNINVENLEILPAPGSKEELEDASLRKLVMDREVKKMSGAMEKLNKIVNNIDSSDKDKNKKD